MIGDPHKEAISRMGYLSNETGSPVQFGREICGSVSDASEREWLVANGIGGFASGTIGLRSLVPEHPNYRDVYGGGPSERDSAYHQGTVWGWLLGPFVQAHLKVFGDPAEAESFLQPIADHIRAHGLSTAGEIFDGDPPHTPRGCGAQAWTVGELLRAWIAVASATDTVASNVRYELAKKAAESLQEEPVASTRQIRIQSNQDGLD